MNRTFLSTFKRCTWAALKGLGASTIPDTAAVPAICAASCARAGAISVVPPSIVHPIASRVGSSRLIRMAALLRRDGLWVATSLIGHARQRMGNRVLERLGAAPLLRRSALAVRADLVH